MIKPAPRSPVMTPVITAPGIASIVGVEIAVVPNFNPADDISYICSPANNDRKMASENTAIAQEKNTFQTTENFQNVFGFEIS